MNTSTIDCREYPFPDEAKKPGQSDRHCYGVAGRGFRIGILYASEQYNDDGSYGIHVSISYCRNGRPRKVTPGVLRVVQRLIEQQALRWPQRFDSDHFDNGPFAGLGLHIWEST